MTVKLGVLGFAHGHIMSYGNEWLNHPELGIQFTKGWDWNSATKKNCCEKLKMEAAESVEEVLQSCDAVVISSETAFHTKLVELAANAKKDIICYKPMALSLLEADKIVEAVERNGVRFTMAYQMRSDPQNIKIKELVDTGAIGDIYQYRRRHSLSTHLWGNFEDTWHNDKAMNRDIFADDSSHPIDMLNWIFGVPETVSCELTTMSNPKVKNDGGAALFKYKNGMLATISCNFASCTTEPTTEVYGSNGTILQYYGDGVSCHNLTRSGPGLKWHINGDKDWTVSDIDSPSGHGWRIANQYIGLGEFLRGERGPLCSVYEGRDSLRMVLACYLSNNEGRRVRIDDPAIYNI
ncbi:MAG: Gfo/Idh/MocA family oxidoreductase [Clostridiales bacterium]|nr:Gfo/Idh/MocA family oxidoreductase [Clostridiales bacterium]